MIVASVQDGELESRLSLLLQADVFLNSIDSEEAKMLTVDIEYGTTRPIGIVLRLGEYVLAIENKIFEESASDATRLSAQYAELRETLDALEEAETEHPVIIIFLVPKRKETAPKALEAEYENLQVRDPDKKVMVFWNDTKEGTSSVQGIIGDILEVEGRGEINPIHEYTKHTLKGLITFIESNFKGYANPSRSSSGMPSRYDGFWDFDELVKNGDISSMYIGFAGGIPAVFRYSLDELKSRRYGYARVKHGDNWVDGAAMKRVLKWYVNNEKGSLQGDDLPLNCLYPVEVLRRLSVENYSDYCVGFTGGAAAMEKTTSEDLLQYGGREGTLFKLNKCTEVKDAKNWIPLKDFIVLFQRITGSL
jgi:hypothetical protein